MRIKSYFANTVQEAMQKARVELGPEALLLSSHSASKSESGSQYEVTFGVVNETATAVTSYDAGAPDGAVSAQLNELRRQLEHMQRALAWRPATSSSGDWQPESSPWTARLVRAGFSYDLAQDILLAAQPTISDAASKTRAKATSGRRRKAGGSGQSADADAVLNEIERRFAVVPGITTDSDRRIVMLIGPPGAGKTTTLVKLAVQYGTSRRLPLQILSTDTLRLGGAEQLQSYSRILGASYQAVSGRQKLADALQACRDKKLILIDSPGFSPADLEEAGELSGLLGRVASIDVHLVLPATFQAAAIAGACQRFSGFRPSKLIFTHLDEVDSPGTLIEGAMRSGLPISFLANGQQIPENLAEASKRDLREKLARQLSGGMAAAA